MKLTARNSTVTISNKTFIIGGDNAENFLQKLHMEVMENPKKAKELLTFLSATCTMFTSMLVQNNLVLAIPQNVVSTDLTDTLLIAIITIIVIGVGIAMIALPLAGIWKMLFGKKDADEWTVNILKGLGQVILSPIIILFIVAIATLLFKNIPAFQPFTDPIGVFFHH